MAFHSVHLSKDWLCLLWAVHKWHHNLRGRGYKGFCDNSTKALLKTKKVRSVTCDNGGGGGGCVNNYQKLGDFIYGQPLIWMTFYKNIKEKCMHVCREGDEGFELKLNTLQDCHLVFFHSRRKLFLIKNLYFGNFFLKICPLISLFYHLIILPFLKLPMANFGFFYFWTWQPWQLLNLAFLTNKYPILFDNLISTK